MDVEGRRTVPGSRVRPDAVITRTASLRRPAPSLAGDVTPEHAEKPGHESPHGARSGSSADGTGSVETPVGYLTVSHITSPS